MSKIKQEIGQYLVETAVANTELTARFCFPATFIGFQGHFPTTPVLPGACQLQCVLTALETLIPPGVVLREIVQAKYNAPVHPDEDVVCTISVPPPSGEFICRASLAKGAVKVSTLKLRLAVQDAGAR